MPVPLGDFLRSLSLPAWLRGVLAWTKGIVVRVKGVDVALDENPGATPPRSGLDRPARFAPPKVGPRR